MKFIVSASVIVLNENNEILLMKGRSFKERVHYALDQEKQPFLIEFTE